MNKSNEIQINLPAARFGACCFLRGIATCAQTVCLQYTQTETMFYYVCSQSDVSPLNKSTAQSQKLRHFALGIGENPGAPCSAVS